MAVDRNLSPFFSPKLQGGNYLPKIREVGDGTPFMFKSKGYKKLYWAFEGAWEKINVSPDDDLRVNKLGVGLLDTIPITYDITLKDTGQFSHPSYSAGNYKFDGDGFLVDYDNTTSGKSYAVVDNLLVRENLSVYDFLVIQKRFSNGSFAVAPGGGKVSAVSGTSITFEDPSALGVCGFAANDLMLVHRVSPDNGTVLRSVRATASSVSGNTVTVSYDSGTFQVGDEVVVVGNTSDSDRQNLIYMTSDDTGSPFQDIITGVDSWAAWDATDKVQARFGNLSTYTSATFGALSGIGIFIKDNLYIENGFIALGSDGYIRGGKSSYADTTAGFFIGNNGGSKVLNIGDATYYVNWTGSVLNIKGNITLTNTIPLSSTTGDLDDIADGTTYSRVLTTDISAGHILLSAATGDLDDISDGSSYGKILLTDISSGHILLSETVGDLDDIADGTSYSRVAATDISSGHVYLFGINASLNINTTVYGNSGIQLQYNSGTPRMYIGNGATKYFKWDGTDISWSGTNTSLTAAGAFTASNATITGTINASAGTFSGSISSSATITGGTFQTAGSGSARISLSSGWSNEIRLYDSFDVLKGYIQLLAPSGQTWVEATDLNISSTSGNLNLWSTSGTIVAQDNFSISGDLSVTGSYGLSASDIPSLSTSKITSGTFTNSFLPVVDISHGGTGRSSHTGGRVIVSNVGGTELGVSSTTSTEVQFLSGLTGLLNWRGEVSSDPGSGSSGDCIWNTTVGKFKVYIDDTASWELLN